MGQEKNDYISKLEIDLDIIHTKIDEFAKIIQIKDLELCEIYESSKKFQQKDEKLEILNIRLKEKFEFIKDFEEILHELDETRQTIIILEEKIEQKDEHVLLLSESTNAMESELLLLKDFV